MGKTPSFESFNHTAIVVYPVLCVEIALISEFTAFQRGFPDLFASHDLMHDTTP